MWSQTPTYVITLHILLFFCRRRHNKRAGFYIAYYNFTTHQILVRNNVTRSKLCIYANENIDLLFPDQVDVFKSSKVRQAKLITKAITEVFSTFLHFIRYYCRCMSVAVLGVESLKHLQGLLYTFIALPSLGWIFFKCTRTRWWMYNHLSISPPPTSSMYVVITRESSS